MMKVLSIVLVGGLWTLFGASKASPVLPPPNAPNELNEILGRLRKDQARLNEVLKKLEEDEGRLQKFLASTESDFHTGVK